MIRKIDSFIGYAFYSLFFLTPLIVYSKTSELFEFNKMVFVYLMTVIILGLWILKIVINKSLNFKKTYLDIPILLFLFSQLASTIFSIDPRSSFFGYYSRFHGGLLSLISYSFLYWSYVSNIDKSQTFKSLKIIIASGIIVTIWGTLEHYGHSISCLIFPEFKSFDVSCWVQDVQNRVFATLGQPNWLAAWILALLPIPWALALIHQQKNNYRNKIIWIIISDIFYILVLFTKSRSGLLGFASSFFVFWSLYLLLSKYNFVEKIKFFILVSILTITTTLIIGTPWTPNINNLIHSKKISVKETKTPVGPALEVGGTESGQIRKIVWKGALDIWKNYPIFGSGVETFAFSYYNFRPKEHNLVSEWDYLYNKAHNEYLNFAATTGTFGLLTYLALVSLFITSFLKCKLKIERKIFSKSDISKLNDTNTDNCIISYALLAGFSSILITNFFGFSVVAVSLHFFLYPAMVITLRNDLKEDHIKYKLSTFQKISFISILAFITYLIFLIIRYWYADYLYAKGNLNNDSGNFIQARNDLTKAVKLSPNEAVYWDELSKSTLSIAISSVKEENAELTLKLIDSAVTESSKALSLSPKNVNIYRDRASLFIKLSTIDPNYMILAKDTLQEAVKLAPTDAKLFYNLALTYLRTGDSKTAIDILNKTLDLKPNYRDAHYALGLVYADAGEINKAKEEFKYILEKINPEDTDAKREIDAL